MSRSLARKLAAAALGIAVLFAGCSSDEDEEAPAACLADSGVYLAALQAAPGEVRLRGETPISDCLTPDQGGGQLAAIGKEMIAAATILNATAQEDPGGPASTQLGYLLGAVERGSEGIHTDLGRRLDTAARYSPDGLLPAEFERSFGPGYAAGLESG